MIVRTEELANPEYARNGANRCFFCKDELFARLAPVAEREGIRTLVYGANVDDLGDHRPGMKAAAEHGVRAPLIEAALTKAEIRDLSRALGLPTWDKPSFACLSSRFQYGDRITADKLRQVDAAESFVRSLGFRQFRVRHHERLARLEIPVEEIPRLWEEGRHEAIVARFRELGYIYVAVDLAGFERQRQPPARAQAACPWIRTRCGECSTTCSAAAWAWTPRWPGWPACRSRISASPRSITTGRCARVARKRCSAPARRRSR